MTKDRSVLRPWRWRGPGAAVALACVVIAAVTGCGGSGLPVRSASHSPGHSPSPHSTAIAQPVPTGPELAKLLPPHTSWPPQWTRVTTVGLTRNLTPPYAKPLADLGPTSSLKTCINWNTTLTGQEAMLPWDMSWASSSADPPHYPSNISPVIVMVADFLPGDVSKQFAWDTAFAARCHSYRDPTNGSQVTITAAATAGLGNQGLYVQVVNPYNYGGMVVRAHDDVLLIRVGNNMIGVSQNGATTDPTDPVVPYSDLKQAAEYYLNSVSHLSD